MTFSPEKNDVDVARLFSWGRQFEILNVHGSPLEPRVHAYIRLVGDAELNRARVYGLRKSAELRKTLRKEDSDERMAYIPDIESLDKDTLVEAIVLSEVNELSSKAIKELSFTYPTEPDSEATLEDMERYQEEVDNWPNKRNLKIRERIESKVEERRVELRKLEEKELYKQFESMVINQICENEMVIKFKEMCVFFGTFEDEKYKKKFFKKFEEFENLPTFVKDQFTKHYSSLEISTDDLKK